MLFIHKSPKLILVMFFALFFASCSHFRLVTIEVQNPPKVDIPDSISSLTIMNRSITGDFFNFNKDSLQKVFYNNGFKINANVLDSLASDTCIKALGEMLYESERFDVVIPNDRNIKRTSRYYEIDSPLKWDFVDTICETYQTDALLVMERYINQVNTGFSFELSNNPLYGDLTSKWYGASIDLYYNATFRLYYPKIRKILYHFIISDSIFWDNDDLNQKVLFENLPSIKECVISAGIKTAIDLDDVLSPVWKSQSRGYFILNKKDSLEIKHIQENRWDELLEYYQKYSDNKKKSVRSKAEFNLALATEMTGNPKEALRWLQKSYKTMYRKQTEDYLIKLKSRIKELGKISQKTDSIK